MKWQSFLTKDFIFTMKLLPPSLLLLLLISLLSVVTVSGEVKNSIEESVDESAVDEEFESATTLVDELDESVDSEEDDIQNYLRQGRRRLKKKKKGAILDPKTTVMKTGGGKSKRKFVSYESSEWEQTWLDNVGECLDVECIMQ